MKDKQNRREFLKKAALSVSLLTVLDRNHAWALPSRQRPNLLFIFADQWRAQSTGYAGNPDVQTPHLDRLAAESVNYATAVSNCPVCSPFRASLLTGQYPLSHGVFLNDLQLNTTAVSFAQAFSQAGYTTGYIGKWHLDGSGRSSYIPPARRQGFDYWKVLECTHNYNHSAYYANADSTQRYWDGYDAYAQTADAMGYLQQRAEDRQPFALFVSWGSPHSPYRTGPKELLEQYDHKPLPLRDNVPANQRKQANENIAGYYAHITALDDCVGRLMQTLKNSGLEKNTIVVFTSDHGDMLYSQGLSAKQKPWDESIRIPFLLRCPREWPDCSKTIEAPISVPDMMPTLLGLCGVAIPGTCEGQDLSKEVLGQAAEPEDRTALLMCPAPFGQWTRANGGREYRGIRTKRYTYVRDLNGPWLLYDNQADPLQQKNLIGHPEAAALEQKLEKQLQALLKKTGDAFLAGPELIARCGYRVDDRETVDHTNHAFWGQVSVACRREPVGNR